MNDNEKQPKTTEIFEKPQPESAPQTLAEKRTTRIEQIENELADFNHAASSQEEIDVIQSQREQEYQSKLTELESGLGQKLSEESTEMIHSNLVNSVIEQAQK